MSVPPCWRSCGRPAESGSLSCAPCRVQDQAAHDAIQGRRQLAYAREVEAANRAARASRYVACRRCGKPDSVLASWARLQEIEAERRDTERGLRPTHGDQAYTTAIALSTPAGNFDPEDCCSDCTRAKYADFYNA